jgi:hypothetical protein
MLAAMRAVALEDISIFTNEVTPAKALFANYRSDESGPFLQKEKRGSGLCHCPFTH